ncbi:MAG: hypothetical protein RJB38_1765 [Pseudomonadota bacterium]
MTALELLICGALVGCSAFLSASEIAIFSLSRFQLRGLRDRFKPAQRKIKKLQTDASGLLITVLILNEVVNISLSTLLTGIIDRWLGGEAAPWLVKTLLGVLITTPVVLLFCEVTPKTIAARGNTLIAPLVATPIHALYQVMRPLRSCIRWIIDLFGRPTENAPADRHSPLNEAEFMVMVEEGHREGAIQRSELDLIRNVFAMEETPIHQIMTPLAQVQTLNESLTVSQAIEQVRLLKLARIPIMSKTNKEVQGILYMKDLLRARLNPALASSAITPLLHRPLRVPSQMPINRVFKRFRQSQTHIAIVEDSNQSPIGVVTLDQILDDLLEELLTRKDR